MKRTDYYSLMERRIRRILMISSSYDAYILEEDGQIEAQLYREYIDLNISNPPALTWVNTTQEAIDLLEKDPGYDLIIDMFNVRDAAIFDQARHIRERWPGIPIVILTNFSRELLKKIASADQSAIDYIFTWNGNADLILAIVKLLEDRMNADADILSSGVQAILLVEDSIRYYSTYLPAIYKLVLKQSAEFLKEALNEQQLKLRKRARPKILLATNYDEAMELYTKYRKNLLGVISDVGFVMHRGDGPEKERIDAGIELCRHIKRDIPQMPVILQSSQGSVADTAREMGVGFIEKYSSTLLIQLSEYISEEFGFGDFVVKDLDTHLVIARAKDLREMQALISEIPDRELDYYCSKNRLSKWMYSRGLFTLGRRLRKASLSDFSNPGDARQFIIRQIKDYRILAGQGIIASFDKDSYTRYIHFARMGEGSLGGKARGLAFMNNVLQRYGISSKYPGVRVSIPRTVVVATDYFDRFILENGLQYVIDANIPDEELLSEFVSSRLPEELVEQLRAYIGTVSTPLAVRSSSKLEDSHYQPFAGIYSTYMIPCVENRDQMLRLLGKAIKSVYASVYLAASRAYLHTTGNLLSEEKMAVVIQDVCGTEDRGYFFPTASGVAKSMNFYPMEGEKPEDGVVNIAFGLGKLVVDGGKTLRFCPRYPAKAVQMSTPRFALKDGQDTMYALDLKPEEFKTSIDDGINIHKFSIPETEGFRNLSKVASTWDYQSQMLRPGTFSEGMRVISFANILQYDVIPLPRILTDLLDVCRHELRCEVEMEFALDMDVPKGENAVLSVLQVRPIADFAEEQAVDWSSVDTAHALVYSENALGSGHIEGITDVVFVKPGSFDKSRTEEMAAQIEEINSLMGAQGRSYVLIGPGRWGSSDPWLGIPVRWNQISEAKVIVECGLKDFCIDPSQGTHFFQNITSLGIGYFIVNPFRGEGVCDLEMTGQAETVMETAFIKAVHFPEPLEVFIDGRSGRGVIAAR